MKLRSSESNRSLATGRKEAGLKKKGKGKQKDRVEGEREGGRNEELKRLIFCTEGGN